ncbi:Uncharacterized protein Rs2_30582 [Raphanus sativus]|nr:Uncharacterized protein Rs2_30582 [Raphanus sativus]
MKILQEHVCVKIEGIIQFRRNIGRFSHVNQQAFSLRHEVLGSRSTSFLHQNKDLTPAKILFLVISSISSTAVDVAHLPKVSPSSPPMDLPVAAASSASPCLPPEPLDAELDVKLPVDPPAPSVPPDPPPALWVKAFHRQISSLCSASLHLSEPKDKPHFSSRLFSRRRGKPSITTMLCAMCLSQVPIDIPSTSSTTKTQHPQHIISSTPCQIRLSLTGLRRMAACSGESRDGARESSHHKTLIISVQVINGMGEENSFNSLNILLIDRIALRIIRDSPSLPGQYSQF